MAGHLAASDIDLSTIRILVIIVRADPGLRRAGDFDTARIAHNCAWPIDVVLAIDTKYASTFVSGWSLSVRGHGADRDSSYCGQEMSFHPVFSRKQCADLGEAPLGLQRRARSGRGSRQYRDGNFLPPRCKVNGSWGAPSGSFNPPDCPHTFPRPNRLCRDQRMAPRVNHCVWENMLLYPCRLRRSRPSILGDRVDHCK